MASPGALPPPPPPFGGDGPNRTNQTTSTTNGEGAPRSSSPPPKIRLNIPGQDIFITLQDKNGNWLKDSDLATNPEAKHFVDVITQTAIEAKSTFKEIDSFEYRKNKSENRGEYSAIFKEKFSVQGREGKFQTVNINHPHQVAKKSGILGKRKLAERENVDLKTTQPQKKARLFDDLRSRPERKNWEHITDQRFQLAKDVAKLFQSKFTPIRKPGEVAPSGQLQFRAQVLGNGQSLVPQHIQQQAARPDDLHQPSAPPRPEVFGDGEHSEVSDDGLGEGIDLASLEGEGEGRRVNVTPVTGRDPAIYGRIEPPDNPAQHNPEGEYTSLPASFSGGDHSAQTIVEGEGEGDDDLGRAESRGENARIQYESLPPVDERGSPSSWLESILQEDETLRNFISGSEFFEEYDHLILQTKEDGPIKVKTSGIQSKDQLLAKIKEKKDLITARSEKARHKAKVHRFAIEITDALAGNFDVDIIEDDKIKVFKDRREFIFDLQDDRFVNVQNDVVLKSMIRHMIEDTFRS